MMQTMDCNEARISLGVYVLGAIDPAERALVDAHLATCQECRDELVDLAGLPALLSRVGKEDALQLVGDEAPSADEPTSAPQPELLGTVLDLTAARRRRRTWRNALTAAAAAVIVAAGSFTGAHYLTSSGSTPPTQPVSSDPHPYGPAVSGWEQVSAYNSTNHINATVAYQWMGWGLRLATKVVGVGVNTTCQLYVIPKHGKPILAGSWVTDTGENNVWYSGGAAIAENDIKQFEVTTGPSSPPVYMTPR
jgi:hypothetical protein